jgi:hypothetical protein
MTKRPNGGDQAKERYLEEFKRQLAIERFQEERPQLWLQSQRVGKLVEIQNQLEQETFPEGSCFLHANLVGSQSFCVKKITGIDLDTCQVTLEIYGDDDVEGGIVVLPLETIEWFGFPAKAVSMGVHFQGFTGHRGPEAQRSEAKTEKVGKDVKPSTERIDKSDKSDKSDREKK